MQARAVGVRGRGGGCVLGRDVRGVGGWGVMSAALPREAMNNARGKSTYGSPRSLNY